RSSRPRAYRRAWMRTDRESLVNGPYEHKPAPRSQPAAHSQQLAEEIEEVLGETIAKRAKPPVVQVELTRARDVGPEALGHRASDAVILHGHVHLEVRAPRAIVHVVRAHGAPAVVDDRGLRVEHGPVPLVELDARAQVPLVEPATGVVDGVHVALTRDEHLHVDPALAGRRQ